MRTLLVRPLGADPDVVQGAGNENTARPFQAAQSKLGFVRLRDGTHSRVSRQLNDKIDQAPSFVDLIWPKPSGARVIQQLSSS